MLDREEYIEQAHFFRALSERTLQNAPTQDLLRTVREEILSTTKLPMAIDFLTGELNLTGVFAPGMARLSHYFSKFQTFVVSAAENDKGKFDLVVGLEILEREARYRSAGATPQGIFLFQFECLSRNRLGYDRGLEAIAADSIFDETWREWILTVRRQIGMVDLADLIYVRSEYYNEVRAREGAEAPTDPPLFGLKEGRIALANRRKDPLLLFAAMQRHLNYPLVPRTKPVDESRQIIPNILRRVERLEARLKLMEEEQKGGIDLTKFYGRPLPVDDENPDG
ncbi:MAG TPA: hypothetical protein VGJ26_22295 [Pirellulales bacterium]|jgi:hypothetical protein